MIADMALHGFSPREVGQWSLGRWLDVSKAFSRAYASPEAAGAPPPTDEELKAFLQSEPR